MNQRLKFSAISLLSAVIGGGVVYALMKDSPPGASIEPKKSFDEIVEKRRELDRSFDTFFNDDFFRRSDPFEEMKRLREQMQRQMENFDSRFSTNQSPFDSWFSGRFGGGTLDDITQREDENFVYYDIVIKDLESTSIKTRVENGQVTVSGTIERTEEESEEDVAVFSSTFSRSFPVPMDVDASKMEIEPNENGLTLKFPKVE